MLHRSHVVFWHRICNVEDEEIEVRVAVGQQAHQRFFGLSGTFAFGLSGTDGAKQAVWPFRNQSLALSEPKFGPFGTRRQLYLIGSKRLLNP